MNRYRYQVVSFLAVTLLCIVGFILFDIPVTRFFARFRPDIWIEIWTMVTGAGESQWYLVGGLASAAVFWRSNRHAALSGLFLFTTVAVSGLAADLLKALFGRARPVLLLDEGLYGFAGFQIDKVWTSFPSGHSATALSTAVTLSILFPRFRWLFSVAGVLIAFSRIALCQHYLSDVVAGSCLGVVTVFFLYNRYFEKPLHDSCRS